MPDTTGRQYIAIPGPSVIPDAVLQAMHRPAPNIYEGEMYDLTLSLIPDLKHVAGTEGDVAMYIGNGHGMWEAALSNVISRGDRVLSAVTGRFGLGWSNVAQALGAQVERIDFGLRAPVDAARIEEALRADKSHAIKAVTMVHVDTATSVLNDVAAVRRALDAAGHPALLMVDCIASMACDRYEMDAMGADVTITASQKGLMTPPGMGFVFFNAKARVAGADADRRTPYWDWTVRADATELYQFYNGTSPTHHLFALRKALDLIKDEGMDAIWARHDRHARAYWAAVEAWGKGGTLEMNISDPANRSRAVSALRIEAPHGTELRNWVSENAGVTLGIGLGMAEPGSPAADGFFRIGHMGHVNAHMVLGVIGTIDAAFKALGIPHGSGASEAAASVIAAG